MKVLYKDKRAKEATILFETQPGTVIPEHIHGGVEWAFILEGTLEDEEGVCSAGNFVIRAAESRHAPPYPERCPIYRPVPRLRAFGGKRKFVS